MYLICKLNVYANFYASYWMFEIYFVFVFGIIEAPDEPYDPRSLYERLQEQKNKRDMEYEEAHKLSK